MSQAPIVAIDDSLTIRKLVELALGPHHPLHLAGSATEGVALVKRTAPCLVLLDHILPDRRGPAVCAELAADPATAAIPIVVMSAKGDDVRPLFRPFPSVVEFVAKPFSPAAILRVVAQVLERRAAVPGAPPAPVLPQAGEAAARALYGALQERLERVPGWIAELGGTASAPALARRMLTPDVVARVLAALAPHLPAPPGAPAPAANAGGLSGSTATAPLATLLRLFADTSATGELRLGEGEAASLLYLERGELVLAATAGPAAARAVATAAGCAADEAAMARAAAAARSEDVPVLAALLGDGEAAVATAWRSGLALAANLLGAEPQPFAWRERRPLPEAVRRLAKPLPPEQLELARLRQVDDWAQIELEVASLEQVCTRAQGLAARLARLDLDPVERRVLMLVDGRRSVRCILERSRLSTFDVHHALFRLIRIGVLLPRPAAAPAPPPLLWCGADEAVRAPLERLCAERGWPAPICAADGAAIAAAVAEQGVRLALVDAGAGAEAVAGAVRGRLESAHATLVALLDRPDAARSKALTEAGFDAVLSRPMPVSAVLRLAAG